MGQELFGFIVKQLTFMGERHLTGGAVKQLDLVFFFQGLNGIGDIGARQAQLFRHLGKRVFLCNPTKNFQALDFVHIVQVS